MSERVRRWRIYMQCACMFFLNSQVFQGIVFWVNEWEKPLKGERAFALVGLDATPFHIGPCLEVVFSNLSNIGFSN